MKRWLGLVILAILSASMTGCFGPRGDGGSTSADFALLSNRAKAVQKADDLNSVLGYIYDPLELNLTMTFNGKPFCDAYLDAAPECEDTLSEAISHQELVDLYSEIVAPENRYEDLGYDYSFTDPVISINGETGQITRTYTISNVDLFADGQVYNVSGVYQTDWTKVSGEWRMYKLTFTINIVTV